MEPAAFIFTPRTMCGPQKEKKNGLCFPHTLISLARRGSPSTPRSSPFTLGTDKVSAYELTALVELLSSNWESRHRKTIVVLYLICSSLSYFEGLLGVFFLKRNQKTVHLIWWLRLECCAWLTSSLGWRAVSAGAVRVALIVKMLWWWIRNVFFDRLVKEERIKSTWWLKLCRFINYNHFHKILPFVFIMVIRF